MLTAIFASRKTQRQYALKLSGYISSLGGSRSLVLWYKDLFKFKYLLKAAVSSRPSVLDQAVFEVVAEKKNHPNYRQSNALYWKFLILVKKAESKVLYTMYVDQLVSNNVDQLVIWNGLKFRQRIAVFAAHSLSIPCHFIERGAFPGTTTLDSQGINYLNSVPRDPSFYMERDVNNYSVFLTCEDEKPQGLPDDFIFIPFQVNIDSQITMFSPWLDDMFSLVDRLLEVERILGDEMPNIVLKPHPSCDQCYKDLFDKIAKKSNKIAIVNLIDTPVLIREAKAVITINSSVGMEALLMRKKVIVLGEAFYNIHGLTLSARSLEELVHTIKRLALWKPNEYLTASFLDYLKSEYVVKGSWHKPDLEHLQCMTQRLTSLVSA